MDKETQHELLRIMKELEFKDRDKDNILVGRLKLNPEGIQMEVKGDRSIYDALCIVLGTEFIKVHEQAAEKVTRALKELSDETNRLLIESGDQI